MLILNAKRLKRNRVDELIGRLKVGGTLRFGGFTAGANSRQIRRKEFRDIHSTVDCKRRKKKKEEMRNGKKKN